MAYQGGATWIMHIAYWGASDRLYALHVNGNTAILDEMQWADWSHQGRGALSLKGPPQPVEPDCVSRAGPTSVAPPSTTSTCPVM